MSEQQPARRMHGQRDGQRGPRSAGQRWSRSLGFVLGGAVLVVVFVATAVPSSIAPHPPVGGPTFEALAPPSRAFPMGTDVLGRDVFSRVVHGARIAVASATLALGIALVLGRTMAVLARYAATDRGRWLRRAVELLTIVPTAATALLLAYLVGPGVAESVVAVGVSLAPALAHAWWLPSGRDAGTVDARSAAAAPWTVVATTVLAFGTATLSLAAIDFIGLGWATPAPAWGVMLSQGHGLLGEAWWLSVFPGALVLSIVLATMVVGDGLLQMARADRRGFERARR